MRRRTRMARSSLEIVVSPSGKAPERQGREERLHRAEHQRLHEEARRGHRVPADPEAVRDLVHVRDGSELNAPRRTAACCSQRVVAAATASAAARRAEPPKPQRVIVETEQGRRRHGRREVHERPRHDGAGRDRGGSRAARAGADRLLHDEGRPASLARRARRAALGHQARRHGDQRQAQRERPRQLGRSSSACSRPRAARRSTSRRAATPTSRCRSTSRRRATRRSGTRTSRCAPSAVSSRSSTACPDPKPKPPKPKAGDKPVKQLPRPTNVTMTLYVGPHGKAQSVGFCSPTAEIGETGRRAPRRPRRRLAAARSARPDREARDPLQASQAKRPSAGLHGLRADRRAGADPAHGARLRGARARAARRPRAT